VFRSALISVVLTLALVPTLALVCATRCASDHVNASACHHDASPDATVVAAAETCGIVLSATPFLGENSSRGISAAGADYFVPASGYQLVQDTNVSRPGPEPRPASALNTRPLPAVLRI
jgi:hypothetical protein